jgi:hypothetical protein
MAKYPIRDLADRPQRMSRWHALLQRDITEHVTSLLIGSAHSPAPFIEQVE